MDFNAGSIMINEPFQNYIERDEFDNEFSKRKSYIYVISKVFDGTRYYKVGMSTKSDIKKERDEKLGNQGYWQDKLIGLEFIDKDDKTKRKKTWVIDKVVYRPGKLISTYVVGYKLKGRGSLQDMIGYESQIVELFNSEQFPWFTTERLKKLGVYEKYLEIKKKQEGLT